MLSELPSNSLGAYVISMAKTSSDVLAVMLLQARAVGRAPGARGRRGGWGAAAARFYEHARRASFLAGARACGARAKRRRGVPLCRSAPPAPPPPPPPAPRPPPPPPPPPQRECGVRNMLRVVPLFETLDDLHNAPGTMRTLFGSEWYLKHINGMQVGAVASIWPPPATPCNALQPSPTLLNPCQPSPTS